MKQKHFLGIGVSLLLGLPGCIEAVSRKAPPHATISIPAGVTPLPTDTPETLVDTSGTAKDGWKAPGCGRKPENDGLKSGFTWKPKSDGAWKGSVAVVPWWAGDKCSVKSGKRTYGMRYKGDIGEVAPRCVHILDGIEGDKLKRNTRVVCGCYFWVVPEPSKRTD